MSDAERKTKNNQWLQLAILLLSSGLIGNADTIYDQTQEKAIYVTEKEFEEYKKGQRDYEEYKNQLHIEEVKKQHETDKAQWKQVKTNEKDIAVKAAKIEFYHLNID